MTTPTRPGTSPEALDAARDEARAAREARMAERTAKRTAAGQRPPRPVPLPKHRSAAARAEGGTGSTGEAPRRTGRPAGVRDGRAAVSVAMLDAELARLAAAAPAPPQHLRTAPTTAPTDPGAPSTIPAAAPARGPERTSDGEVVALPDLVLQAGHHDAAVDRASARAARGFLVRVLLVLLVVLVPVALFNRLVDPLGVWGGVDSRTGLAGDLPVKVHLVRNLPKQPDVVFLGASRVQKYDPKDLQRLDGKTAFNAAIAGSSIVESMAFAGWFADRTKRGQAMPHVVYGIAPEEFRSQPTGSGLLRYPELARQLTGTAKLKSEIQDKWEPLFQWGTTKLSWHVLWHRGSDGTVRDAAAAADGGAPDADATPTTGYTTKTDADGFLRSGYGDTTLRSASARSHNFAKFAQQYVDYYERRTSDGTLPGDAAASFEQILKTANAHGDEPTIFLLPMQPQLAAKLAPLGRTDQVALVRAYLTDLQSTYKFHWYDYSDVRSFGGDGEHWYDGAHPMVQTTRLVMRQLLADMHAAGDRSL